MASVTFSGLDPFRLNGITLTKNELGTGSYATVFQLDYYDLKCAGKKIHDLLIKQQAGRGDTYQLTRFAEECRLLSQIRHPNVVQFLGVHYEQGMKVPILVMEFLPIDLTSCIEKNGVLRPELSYSILHDVALGLNYLHSQEPPIIHRDLSSNNVLLTSDMKAKISDLGVAKIVNLTPMQVSRMVHNTQAPGTPAYMPPEALVANPKYDRTIDVFSFGIMIIHIFSGKWPEPQIGQIHLEQESDRMIPVSEAERREAFLIAIGDKHPMMSLIRQCIANNSKKRPNVNQIVLQLKEMVTTNSPSFSNRLEMLQHIDKRKANEEKLQSQIEELQQELKAATAKQDARSAQSMETGRKGPIALAREFKMTKAEFEEQKKVLKEHEEQKRKNDLQKAKREVKQALGESITAAEQQRVLDKIKSQAETGRKQGSPDQSTLDVGRKDVRRQCSLQPHIYDTIPGGAGNDSANAHCRLGNQGKSSSIALAEGCGETFQNENAAFHADHRGGGIGSHGGHADYGGKADHGSHGGYSGQRDHGGGPPYAGDHERAQVHEYLHESNQYQGGTPQQPQQYGDKRYHSNQGPIRDSQGSKQLDPDYVNIDNLPYIKPNVDAHPMPPDRVGASHPNPNPNPAPRKPDHDYVNIDNLEFQPYIKPNVDAHPMPPDRVGASHHHVAGATGGGVSQYIDQPSALHHGSHHVPAQYGAPQDQYMGQPSGSHHQQNFAAATVPPGSSSPVNINPNLTVNSRIQIPTALSTEPFKYGVIQWIGEVPAIQGLVAGIELDDYMEGCTDGTFTSTGQKFFECMPGRGIYYPLANLQPDVRFMVPAAIYEFENPLDDVPFIVAEDQFIEGRHEQIQRYIGDRKGIQGHQNSCYLDSSIFGLFALTDAFDELFLKAESSKTADQNRQAIADLLWKGIVNPLRKNGVVRYESVMALRTKLDEFAKMEGIAHAEKDPERFLNMLFEHALKVDPFLIIRRPYGNEPEFFVQLFVEYKESDKLPSIGLLLHTMFKEQKLSFLQMPSRLLIQVPRFGRQFKTYDKIIPDLKLSVTDLTDEYIQAIPKCLVCNESAELACKQCAVGLSQSGYFCPVCSGYFHTHPNRKDHVLDQNIGGGMEGSPLDLLSVICIENSHYVCFSKEPSKDSNKPHKWIFFDSMASRVYDRFNIPSVTECSDLLNQWVYPANGDLSQLRNTAPRDLPEYVRRFTQDVYLCVYVNTDAILYGY